MNITYDSKTPYYSRKIASMLQVVNFLSALASSSIKHPDVYKSISF